MESSDGEMILSLFDLYASNVSSLNQLHSADPIYAFQLDFTHDNISLPHSNDHLIPPTAIYGNQHFVGRVSWYARIGALVNLPEFDTSPGFSVHHLRKTIEDLRG